LGTHSLHRLTSTGARQRLLGLAHELGVSYFDTAPSYGAGIAELELGRLIRDKRSRLVLTTKFGITTGRLGATVPGWNYAAMAARLACRLISRPRAAKLPPRDFSPGQARSSLESSLRVLKTDYVDILYLHEPALELLADADALAETLEGLRAAGKVRYVGLSGQAPSCASVARKHPHLAEVLQLEASPAADGLPDKVSSEGTAAAVTLCEFPSGPVQAERLRTTMERLLAAAPRSVTLVSTNSEATLRETVAILDNFDRSARRSATSSLA
jgi:aryl-alcohol dehydrogenase-like predicted oxidoreductase